MLSQPLSAQPKTIQLCSRGRACQTGPGHGTEDFSGRALSQLDSCGEEAVPTVGEGGCALSGTRAVDVGEVEAARVALPCEAGAARRRQQSAGSEVRERNGRRFGGIRARARRCRRAGGWRTITGGGSEP